MDTKFFSEAMNAVGLPVTVIDENTDFSELNPHFALLASESYVSPNERAWFAWVLKVEKKLGHSLDGNQFIDGYSLDFASDFFAAGLTVDQYIAEIRADQVEIEAAFGPVVAS